MKKSSFILSFSSVGFGRVANASRYGGGTVFAGKDDL